MRLLATKLLQAFHGIVRHESDASKDGRFPNA